MSADIREQLRAAAGQTSASPDVAGAMRRGVQLRHRRRLVLASATAAAVAVLVGAAVLLTPVGTQQLPPIGDRPSTGSMQQLDVFERPAAQDDRIMGMHYSARAPDDPGVQRRTTRLDAPAPQMGYGDDLADADTYPLDVDSRAARLGWQQDDLTVHLAPPTGDPVDPDLQPLEGEWLYVVLDRPGPNFTGSAPVPSEGTATWAGSLNLGGTRTAILVVGDGLDRARGPAGAATVQDNVVLVEGVGRGDQITLTGPAGQFTLAIPPERTDDR